jgi:hypothetical protein
VAAGLEVDVLDRESGNLAESAAGVDEQPEDRVVASSDQAVALARVEQRSQLLDFQDRHGLLGHDRRLRSDHRVAFDLLLPHEPLEQLL